MLNSRESRTLSPSYKTKDTLQECLQAYNFHNTGESGHINEKHCLNISQYVLICSEPICLHQGFLEFQKLRK